MEGVLLIYILVENTRHISGEMNHQTENIHMRLITMEVTHERGYVYSIQYHIVKNK